MPTQLTCDMCGGELAVTMVTNLANGDTLVIGEACQLTFHLTVAAELIKAMPPELMPAYDEQLTGLVNAYAALAIPAVASTLAGPAAADTDTAEPPAPAEGTADDHAGAPQDQPADGTTQPIPADGTAHRAKRGNPRRPG